LGLWFPYSTKAFLTTKVAKNTKTG
jgi:hypothetical protein